MLVQHGVDDHQGETPEYSMRLLKTHGRPMYRQIHEGVLIDMFKGDTILNRKGEWGSNLPEKLRVGDEEQNMVPGKRPWKDQESVGEGGNPRKRRRCNEVSDGGDQVEDLEVKDREEVQGGQEPTEGQGRPGQGIQDREEVQNQQEEAVVASGQAHGGSEAGIEIEALGEQGPRKTERQGEGQGQAGQGGQEVQTEQV